MSPGTPVDRGLHSIFPAGIGIFDQVGVVVADVARDFLTKPVGADVRGVLGGQFQFRHHQTGVVAGKFKRECIMNSCYKPPKMS